MGSRISLSYWTTARAIRNTARGCLPSAEPVCAGVGAALFTQRSLTFAGELMAVDAVVTVDNSRLHLAGVQGLPTLGLLTIPASWA